MRITKRNLNLLIESLLNEEEHAIPDADPKGKNLDPREGDILDKAKAADNPKAVKVPTPEYANAKKKLGLEAYMHWITNTAETYWTDYALGFVRTRMTCGENLSLFEEKK